MTDQFADRAADWDKPSKIEMTTRFVQELSANLSLEKHWKAFEIGAGTGLVGLQILPNVDSMVFEDTSPAMLDVLQRKLKGDEKVELLEGEIYAYRQSDIDLVFACMAFHHVPDTDKALAHLASIVKSGGHVVIGDLMPEDGSFHSFNDIPHKGFDTDQLTQQFISAGFEVHKAYVYDALERERIPGVMGKYEQFILVAQKK